MARSIVAGSVQSGDGCGCRTRHGAFLLNHRGSVHLFHFGGAAAVGLLGGFYFGLVLAAAEGYFLELLGEVEAELLELVFVAVELDVHKKSGGIFGGIGRKKIRPEADFKGTG